MDKTTDNTSPFKGVEGSQTPLLRRTGGLWQTADSLEYNLLKENAKNNRHNQTEAESVFWQIARCNGLGEKCRRQYVIGDFIVDFIFRKSMLIIELDGGYHRPDQDPLTPLKGEQLNNSNTHSPFKGVGRSLTGDILQDFAKDDKSWINDPEQVERDRERQD